MKKIFLVFALFLGLGMLSSCHKHHDPKPDGGCGTMVSATVRNFVTYRYSESDTTRVESDTIRMFFLAADIYLAPIEIDKKITNLQDGQQIMLSYEIMEKGIPRIPSFFGRCGNGPSYLLFAIKIICLDDSKKPTIPTTPVVSDSTYQYLKH